jgi:hypothetical protein
MSQDIRTLELARMYERQGYYKDALEIYSHLHDQKTGKEIQAGINRMNEKLEKAGLEPLPEEKTALNFEKWLMLLILRHRLNNFIKIRKRLS